MAIYKPWEITSVLLHTATNFKLTISSSFQSQSTLFWELFKWEKICNLVQIEGIVMFKNLFYYVNMFFCWNVHILCLYMLSIIVLRKKLKIGKNRYRQVTLPKKIGNWNRPRKLQSVHLWLQHKDVRVLLPVQLILNWYWLVCVWGEGLTDRSIGGVSVCP